MNASDYQEQAARTLIDHPDFELTDREWTVIINSIALGKAAGGVAEIIKKGIFHRHGLADLKLRHPLNKALDTVLFFFRLRMATLLPSPAITHQMVMIVWNVIGLLGEAGEIAELVMIGLASGRFDRDKLKKEIGDLLWYAASLCTKLEIDLAEAMTNNIAKLMVRYPNGYSSVDSQKCIDVKEVL